jgi:hypothetical protein
MQLLDLDCKEVGPAEAVFVVKAAVVEDIASESMVIVVSETDC